METGLYENPEQVGYIGWIRTKQGTYFVDLAGNVTLPARYEKEGDVYQQFFEEYDPTGDLSFSGIKFRDGAQVTLKWGVYLDCDNPITPSFKKEKLFFDDQRLFYMHPAEDTGDPTHPDIYMPVAGYGNMYYNVPGYGDALVVTPVTGDFIVRIGHIVPNEQLLQLLGSHSVIPAGTKIGTIGNSGTSTGPHCHVELVSMQRSSVILDEIIRRRGLKEDDVLSKILNSADIYARFKIAVNNYCQPRLIRTFNSHSCQRTNGMHCAEITGRLVTYYSPDLLRLGER